MNKKRTNYFIIILNFLAILSIYILFNTYDFLNYSMLRGPIVKSIYDSNIIELLMKDTTLIVIIVCTIMGLLNIFCAIQNRKNKKVLFWQLMLGTYEMIWAVITAINPLDNELRVIKIMMCSIIPLMFALRNIILIKKNKPKKIQIISYIAIIVMSILVLLNIIDIYWDIICIIMLVIYIHYQENDIKENKTRKIINIILYYIIQMIVSIGLLFLVVASLIITKINHDNLINQISDILDSIVNLQGAKKEEVYFVVENNLNYGFINKKGEEKISCEYDGVSKFFEIEIDNQKYYFALAKQNDKFYIISKNNQKFNISDNKYFRNLVNFVEDNYASDINEEEAKRYFSVNIYSFCFQAFILHKTDINEQSIKIDMYDYDKITLQENVIEPYYHSEFTYKNENYTMIIEPMEEGYFEKLDPKCKVTIQKNNGEEKCSIEYLPGFNEYEKTIEILSDGEIVYKNLDEKNYGFYDNWGNKVLISEGYEIDDIINDIIIIYRYDENPSNTEYYCIDKTGNILLKSKGVVLVDDIYIVINENNKMQLYQENLTAMSDEYDFITYR